MKEIIANEVPQEFLHKFKIFVVNDCFVDVKKLDVSTIPSKANLYDKLNGKILGSNKQIFRYISKS